jgi:hypothetical protein
MALKLLAINGNEKATTRLFHLDCSFIDLLISMHRSKAHLIGHPLWGAYSISKFPLYYQAQSILYYSYYGKNLNPSLLEAFWIYYSFIGSSYAEAHENLYFKRLSKLYDKRGDIKGLSMH